MNKILYTQTIKDAMLEGPLTKNEGTCGIKLVGEDKTLEIYTYHSQDCCESVYADWDTVELYYKPIKDLGVISEVTIKAVTDMGFLLVFSGNCGSVKIFIPCYNQQNGYYNSALSLNVKEGNTITEIDLQAEGVVENHENE